MLTGWTFDQRAPGRASTRPSASTPRRHDQGAKTWLGREVAAGRPGAKARWRSTCWPCIRPPRATSATSWRSTSSATSRRRRWSSAWPQPGSPADGDIRAVLRTLFASAEFMAPQAVGAKFKTPYQFVVSAARASGAPVANVAPLLGDHDPARHAAVRLPDAGRLQEHRGRLAQSGCADAPHHLRHRAGGRPAAAGGQACASAPPARAPRGDAGRWRGSAPPPMAAPSPPAPAAAPAARCRAPAGHARRQRSRRARSARSPRNAGPLRAAMLLGSPDFMQR